MREHGPGRERQITLDHLELTLPAFKGRVDAFLGEVGIDISGLEIDHIGVRVNSTVAADFLRDQLLARSIGEQALPVREVRGRPIHVFELAKPLVFGSHEIRCVELPYPGSSHYPKEGWEHVEVIVPGGAQDLQAMEAVFRGQFPEFSSTHTTLEGAALPTGSVSFDFPTGADGELPNPTIVLERERGLSVKFHPVTLKDIRLSV